MDVLWVFGTGVEVTLRGVASQRLTSGVSEGSLFLVAMLLSEGEEGTNEHLFKRKSFTGGKT